jgi:hypothetical protein
MPAGTSPEMVVVEVRRVVQTDLVMKKDPRPWKRPVKVAIRRERYEVVKEVAACSVCADVLCAKIEANGGMPEISSEPAKEYTRDNCPNVKTTPISEKEWERLAPKGHKEEER